MLRLIPAAGRRLFLTADKVFNRPSGRAMVLPVEPEPIRDAPRPEYPFLLNTGRTVEHWHTRTKTGRIAILANDPSHPDTRGAILGDRVSAIYAQDDRVFFRSMATRGSLTGLSAAAPAAIDILRRAGQFDLILVESVGVGQESDPFGVFGNGKKLVDATLFVLAPYYGGRIQLQKIALLNGADFVALNKCDHPMAHTAKAEIQARLDQNGKGQTLHATTAAKHFDPGVDALFRTLAERAGLALSTGGEPACQLRL